MTGSQNGDGLGVYAAALQGEHDPTFWSGFLASTIHSVLDGGEPLDDHDRRILDRNLRIFLDSAGCSPSLRADLLKGLR